MEPNATEDILDEVEDVPYDVIVVEDVVDGEETASEEESQVDTIVPEEEEEEETGISFAREETTDKSSAGRIRTGLLLAWLSTLAAVVGL